MWPSTPDTLPSSVYQTQTRKYVKRKSQNSIRVIVHLYHRSFQYCGRFALQEEHMGGTDEKRTIMINGRRDKKDAGKRPRPATDEEDNAGNAEDDPDQASKKLKVAPGKAKKTKGKGKAVAVADEDAEQPPADDSDQWDEDVFNEVDAETTDASASVDEEQFPGISDKLREQLAEAKENLRSIKCEIDGRRPEDI
jgi:hypothetical protein